MSEFDRDVPLAPLTTLGIGGPREAIRDASTVGELARRCREPRRSASAPDPRRWLEPRRRATRAATALVVQLAIPGVTIRDDGDHAIVIGGRRRRVGRLRRRDGRGRARGRRVPVRNPGPRRRDADAERRRVRPGGRRHDRRVVRVSIATTGELATFDACGSAASRYRTSVFKGSDALGRSLEVAFRLARGEQPADPLRRARKRARDRRGRARAARATCARP